MKKVTYDTLMKKWRIVLSVGGRNVKSGRYETEEEALRAVEKVSLRCEEAVKARQDWIFKNVRAR